MLFLYFFPVSCVNICGHLDHEKCIFRKRQWSMTIYTEHKQHVCHDPCFMHSCQVADAVPENFDSGKVKKMNNDNNRYYLSCRGDTHCLLIKMSPLDHKFRISTITATITMTIYNHRTIFLCVMLKQQILSSISVECFFVHFPTVTSVLKCSL